MHFDALNKMFVQEVRKLREEILLADSYQKLQDSFVNYPLNILSLIRDSSFRLTNFGSGHGTGVHRSWSKHSPKSIVYGRQPWPACRKTKRRHGLVSQTYANNPEIARSKLQRAQMWRTAVCFRDWGFYFWFFACILFENVVICQEAKLLQEDSWFKNWRMEETKNSRSSKVAVHFTCTFIRWLIVWKIVWFAMEKMHESVDRLWQHSSALSTFQHSDSHRYRLGPCASTFCARSACHIMSFVGAIQKLDFNPLVNLAPKQFQD